MEISIIYLPTNNNGGWVEGLIISHWLDTRVTVVASHLTIGATVTLS